jgi:hypothetical protein
MSDQREIEERLKAHLSRVAEQPPAPGLEERIINDVKQPPKLFGRSRLEPSLVLAVVVVLVVALFLATTTGRQVNNVFSNISNGLNQ